MGAAGAVEAVIADALAICAVAAPTFAEGERAALVAGRLRAQGAAPRIDAAGNVVARFGAADGPAAIVAAHLDTVFAAGTPLRPHRDGGVLRGPGIGDDALALAALVHLARRLAGAAQAPASVVLAATVGEEGSAICAAPAHCSTRSSATRSWRSRATASNRSRSRASARPG
ncbi:MAG: M20/M25/M40 family metallo-hydrolase [Solirubrobacterales bacterium]